MRIGPSPLGRCLAVLGLSLTVGCSTGGEGSSGADAGSATTGGTSTGSTDSTGGVTTDDPPIRPLPCSTGQQWTRDPSNPIVAPTATITNMSDPTVIFDDGAFKMWVGCLQDASGFAFVCYSELLPGAGAWSAPEVVFSPSASGGWDDLRVEVPTVTKQGTTFRMWYGGMKNVGPPDPDASIVKLGHATSTDGRTWTRVPEEESPFGQAGLVLLPAMNPAGDAGVVSDPGAAFLSGTHYVWYSAFGEDEKLHISMATSQDGIVWTREPTNPVLSPDVPWEDEGPQGQDILADVSHPSVRWDGTRFVMWYGSFDGTPNETYTGLGVAQSDDGVQWTKSADNPAYVADMAAPSEALGLSTGPEVLEVDGVQHLFYAGANAAGVRVINHATCPSGP